MLEELLYEADGGWGTAYFNGRWATSTYNASLAEMLGGPILNPVAGDIIQASFTSSLQITCGLSGATLVASLALGYTENGGAFTKFLGGQASRQKAFAGGEEDITAIALQGQREVLAGGAFSIGVNGCNPSGLSSVGNWGLYTAWSLRIRHLRPNP